MSQVLLLVLGCKSIDELRQFQGGENQDRVLISASKELVAPPPSYFANAKPAKARLHVSPPPEHGGQSGRGEAGKGVTRVARLDCGTERPFTPG